MKLIRPDNSYNVAVTRIVRERMMPSKDSQEILEGMRNYLRYITKMWEDQNVHCT